MPRLRLDYLDGLRGLAALYVVLHHAYYGLTGERQLPHLVAHLTYWLYLGRSAVDIFIVLSGYCLMIPVARNAAGVIPGGITDFVRRRARRILPPYYAALFVSLLGIWLVPALHRPPDTALWSTTLPAWTPGVLLSHLLLIHNFDPAWHSKIDYPMWSVATEWQIYFLFPFLLLPAWRRGGPLALLLVAFVVGLVPLMLFPDRFSGAASHFLGLFALGMAGADLNFSPRPQLQKFREKMPWGVLALLSTLGLGVASVLHGDRVALLALKDILVGLATACLLVFCTRSLTRRQAMQDDIADSRFSPSRTPWVLRVLESRMAVGLGAFSYSLYLIHAPVLAICQAVLRPLPLSPTLSLVLLLAVGTPLALGVAYLFYLAFERPFLRNRAVATASGRRWYTPWKPGEPVPPPLDAAQAEVTPRL